MTELKFTTVDPVFIPLADGVRLAARMWLPETVERVPAILEAVPYRRNDGTFSDDHPRYSWWANRGFAGVRVDIRGSGDSDGLITDEYLAQEQDDACEVIAWLAEQPWCNGKVAMIGFSWGGFAAVQVAARRPLALAAIVTINSVVRRYTDDCHYTGGCVNAHDMLSWATTMHAYDARPPDPAVVGESWRERWHERLAAGPPMIEPWLTHQLEDDYWRHGSVCFDYARLTVPVLAVGGWADPYRNAVVDLVDNLPGQAHGIIGPWGHGYPQVTRPGPQIDFLGECAAFFNCYLRDGAPYDRPPLRLFVQDFEDPTLPDRSVRAGRWMATTGDPAQTWDLLIVDGEMGSDERCGSAAGAWCPYSDGGLPGDQRPDDARSFCTDTAPLTEDLELVGFPELRLQLESDRPNAFVAARLCDVAPDGTSCLVTRGFLNLTHRDGHDHLVAVESGETMDVTFRLDACAHRFRVGHRIRLALSASYWPWIWPSPEPVVLRCRGGSLRAPLLPPTAVGVDLGTPRQGQLADLERLTPRLSERQPDFLLGRMRINDLDVEVEESGTNDYPIVVGDPCSATVHVTRRVQIARGPWDTTVEVDATMTCTHETFHVTTTLAAWECEEVIHRSTHETVLPRNGG